MSIFLQIGLGLIPAGVALIVLLFLRKCFSFKTVFMTLFSVTLIIAIIFNGSSEEMTAKALAMSKSEMMDLAYSLVNEEAWDCVDEIINEYSASYGYDDECTLLCARSAAIKGKSQSSAAIYGKLVQMDKKYKNNLENEIEKVTAACAYRETDSIMLGHIKKSGKKPKDYGIDTNVDKDVIDDMVSAIRDIVSDECEKRNISERIEELAALIKNTEALYESYITTDSSTSKGEKKEAESYGEQAEELVGDFSEAAQEYPEAFTVYPIRMSRLRACILAEDYDSIAAVLDNFASYDELMITSELYMNDYISDRNFSKSWRDNDKEKLDKVCKQLKKNLSSRKLSEENLENIKDRIEMLKDTVDGDVLQIIKSRLNRPLNDETISADKSKIYLQNSKIDRYLGDEESATKNMIMAIDTAANSKDDNYSYPMCEISGIITGTSDSENVKNIAVYVDQVVENSLTVQPLTDIFNERKATETETGKAASEKDSGFARYMEEQVSLYGAAVNIGMIDYTSFPEITARVQLASDFISDESDAKKYVSVTDCYQNIDDFTLKKINYTESNIMLLCDNSGSMDGSIGQLQDAVKSFVSSSNEDENISLVTFDSSILAETGFGSADGRLQGVISGMDAMGGTNIYGSVIYGIEKFPYDPKANNVMIVMTDGQDGNSKGYETLRSDIGLAAENKGITIYTLGLGSSVDASYLTNIASVGGGDFIYASDTGMLENLYELIHGQAKNQYLLEYTAYDTLTVNNRELTVNLNKENLSDTKQYSLSDTAQETENEIKIVEDLYVYGFDTRIIYKGEKDTTVKFAGGGFKKDEAISLVLDGSIDYTLKATYVDENTYSVVIPYGVAVDTYNLKVTVGKNSTVLPNELYVVDKEQKSVTFGAYTFTANKIVTENDASTLLTGMVTMNGWLRFNGDVRLSGDIKNGYSIVMHDYNGANIAFDAETAKGIAKSMADKGRTMAIGALRDLTLYNDSQHMKNVEDYHVQQYSNIVVKFLSMYTFVDTDIMLYPDRFVIAKGNLSTMLPFQNQFIKAVSGEDPFSVDIDVEIPINKNGIYGNVDIEYKDEGFFKGAKLFSGYVQLKEGGFHWHGLDNEISFNFMVNFNFVKEAAIGLTLGWKENYWDTALLHVDTDVELNVSGVPVTLSDFSGGLKDMSVHKDKMTKERIWNSTLSVGTKISVAKLSSYFKTMSKYFGDISVVSTDDFELKMSLGQGYFSAKTDVMLLEEVELAGAELEFGNISYTNTMLGLEDVDAKGVRAFLQTGFMYDKLDGLKIDLSVSGELNLHSKFCGIKGVATGSLLLEWWLFDKEFAVSDEALVGLYFDHYNRLQFVIGYREVKNNKTGGQMVYISSDGLNTKEL